MIYVEIYIIYEICACEHAKMICRVLPLARSIMNIKMSITDAHKNRKKQRPRCQIDASKALSYVSNLYERPYTYIGPSLYICGERNEKACLRKQNRVVIWC